MRQPMITGFVLALLATSAALSQSTPTVSPQALRSVSETDFHAAQIAQLKAKVDQQAALLADTNAKLTAALKRIDGLEQAQKATATKGFETAGKLSALEADFRKHTHHSMYLEKVPEGGVEKTKIRSALTTIPALHCKPNPDAGGSGPLSEKFTCDPAFRAP